MMPAPCWSCSEPGGFHSGPCYDYRVPAHLAYTRTETGWRNYLGELLPAWVAEVKLI